jgi:hypothetical protein
LPTWDITASGTTLHFTHVCLKGDGKWLVAAVYNAIPASTPSHQVVAQTAVAVDSWHLRTNR